MRKNAKILGALIAKNRPESALFILPVALKTVFLNNRIRNRTSCFHTSGRVYKNNFNFKVILTSLWATRSTIWFNQIKSKSNPNPIFCGFSILRKSLTKWPLKITNFICKKKFGKLAIFLGKCTINADIFFHWIANKIV